MAIKWIIVSFVFAGDIPMDSRIFLLDSAVVKSEADCGFEIAKLAERARKSEVDLWAECIEVKRMPTVSDAPKGEAGTEQRS